MFLPDIIVVNGVVNEVKLFLMRKVGKSLSKSIKNLNKKRKLKD